jgi:hypothetical protein
MSSLTAKSLRLLLLCVFPALLFSTASSAQVDSVRDDTSTPVPGVGHDYIKSLVETVSIAGSRRRPESRHLHLCPMRL